MPSTDGRGLSELLTTRIREEEYQLLCTFAHAEWDRLTQAVIKQVRELPDECRQSGDDSLYLDVWEEYVSQVQGQESVMFSLYEHTIGQLCEALLAPLPDSSKALLWVFSGRMYDTDAYDDEEPAIPFGDPVDSALVAELKERVKTAAMDEDLPSLQDRLMALLPWQESFYLSWLKDCGYDFDSFFVDADCLLDCSDEEIAETARGLAGDLVVDLQENGFSDGEPDLTEHVQDDLVKVLRSWKQAAAPVLERLR